MKKPQAILALTTGAALLTTLWSTVQIFGSLRPSRDQNINCFIASRDALLIMLE